MFDFGRNRGSNHGSFIVDGSGTILGFDDAMEALTLWPAVEVVGHSKDLIPAFRPGDRNESPIRSVPLYEGRIPGPSGPRNLKLLVNCGDGRRLDLECSARPLDGSGERILVTVLRVLARSAGKGPSPDPHPVDTLTGLPDREAFGSILATDFRDATASAHPLALVLLDVDHLREVNDQLGRGAGDEVLRQLAGILRVAVKDERRVFRLRDDDFVIVLPKGGRGEARQLAAALRSTIERFHFLPVVEPQPRSKVTISLGAASFPADADNPSELFARAQEALNEARSMGRNRVWCYLRRPRVPVEVPVFFDGAEPLLVGYTRDLSPSGIFVQTAESIEVGMRCALAFPLPGHRGNVHVVGRVVRMVPPEIIDESQCARAPGLGIEFERFGGTSDRRAIDCFLHDRESTSLRPENGTLSFP